MRIGFDLDGVVYDFRRALSDYLLAKGLDHCTIENTADHWDFFEGWDFTVADFLREFTAGVDAGVIFRRGEPLPQAVWATRSLAELGHTIHIVTDRMVGTDPGASQRATAAWLADHGFVFHSLTFSADKTVVATDVFIEDKLGNADALNAAGSRCYLINRPWNHAPDLDGHAPRLRVADLREFVAEVIVTDIEQRLDVAEVAS